jgi:hypothetical protein
MILNDPALLATLAGLHDAYERALAANDIAALRAFFWDSPHVVRYGVAEQLYGSGELQAYRQSHTPAYTGRRIVRREIATFGPACATIMTEIELMIDGQPRANRQSQTWILLPELGWRIVAAHVSAPLVAAESPWAVHADSMARILGLALAAEHRSGVIGNLERTAAIAAPLLAFSLPDETEPASHFHA